ncbi:hypothetical protein CARUB_v10012742mg [Capsella rubella]|uniref:Uncharacterized protein n=1 Tax=Capsella rubella TaxID=81985 RepID=R0GIV7_9BRAS|nr:hypothetical protein CARUB_v10012742mg [Capsella rubella]
MAYIPKPLLMDIVRRVGKQGFRHLGPFISAGKFFHSILYSPEVLAKVDVDEFIINGTLARESSGYQPFLLACVDAENSTAHFVEAIRRFVQVGPTQETLNLLGEAAPDSSYAKFAYEIFLILCGSLEDGLNITNFFLGKLTCLAEGIAVGDTVESLIREIGPTGNRVFEGFFHFGLQPPQCLLQHFSSLDICEIALPLLMPPPSMK